MILPKARINDIIVQDLNDEVLVYNLSTYQAFCLNETSAKVFIACDGQTSFDDLKRQHKFTDDLIYFALDELKTNDLIENYESNNFEGLSRREAIRQVGLATMVALPVIAELTAPLAAQAQSAANVCVANNCADGNSFCNGAPGCGALGFVCCYVPQFNACNCASLATCTGNGGQVCA